jgi:hypothetical protein
VKSSSGFSGTPPRPTGRLPPPAASAAPDSFDVLVVASHRDFAITRQCLWNLAAYVPYRRRVYLVTNQPRQGEDLVATLGLSGISVIPDAEVLSAREGLVPGWYKQQIIKLRANRVLGGNILCVLSGDTLLARLLPSSELIAPDGRPYLYVNRYCYPSPHLAYERRRVRAAAQLLGIAPTISLDLGDFISDLFCFERDVLEFTVARLEHRFGRPWTRILEGRGTSEGDQAGFGEYTLYAVTALELMPEQPPVRMCQETHVLQLHSRHAFEVARFQAPIVHIVDKKIPLDEIAKRAAFFGKDLRPAKNGEISGS